jgi:hypothetical protein
MASSSESRELLSRVLTLIRRDIKAIGRVAKGSIGPLLPEHASTLVKYSGALLAISKDADEAGDEERKQLGKLKDEELYSRAEAALAQWKAKKVKT